MHDLYLLELVKSQEENVCQACASSGVLSCCVTSWLDFLCFGTSDSLHSPRSMQVFQKDLSSFKKQYFETVLISASQWAVDLSYILNLEMQCQPTTFSFHCLEGMLPDSCLLGKIHTNTRSVSKTCIIYHLSNTENSSFTI